MPKPYSFAPLEMLFHLARRGSKSNPYAPSTTFPFEVLHRIFELATEGTEEESRFGRSEASKILSSLSLVCRHFYTFTRRLHKSVCITRDLLAPVNNGEGAEVALDLRDTYFRLEGGMIPLKIWIDSRDDVTFDSDSGESDRE
jgi:hypothetical protein